MINLWNENNFLSGIEIREMKKKEREIRFLSNPYQKNLILKSNQESMIILNNFSVLN